MDKLKCEKYLWEVLCIAKSILTGVIDDNDSIEDVEKKLNNIAKWYHKNKTK